MKGINSGSDKVYASKSTSDMNKDNLYASELFPGTFKTKKSNTPLNQKNESGIKTNESNSYIMKNESEETGISDNQHKNVMDNFTSFVPFMLPSFIDNDSIRNNNVHIMLPGKSNLTDIPDSSLASPNPFEPVIKKIKHYLYLSAGATWNIRYNKDYHHFSPYGGIAYQYVMPGKPFGFGTEVMYFYILNNNMKLFTSKSTQYDFGFKNDSSLFTYKKLHILRFPLKFFRITKMGDIHAGVSMDYILYTRGTLDKYTSYSLYNSSYNSQSANNYITALRPYVFSVMTGYGYSFHKKWKLNADIFYNINAYGINDTYVINPIQRGVGIIIRISYNFYRK
jgi:hypothetical protein